MTIECELVLERLEAITSEVAGLLEPSSSAPNVLDQTGPLLAQRGKLVEELASCLTSDHSLSYQQLNRLIVIQAQGGQIASSLTTHRFALSELITQAQGKQAYADLLQGMIGPEATIRLEDL